MPKLTLIINQNKKTKALKKLAQELKQFKEISFAPLPEDCLCMVLDSAKPKKKKGGKEEM